MGSTPYPGTIQDLTFNLFSILADNHLLANALFWITVWITDKVHGPWTTDRGYWSRLSLRFGAIYSRKFHAMFELQGITIVNVINVNS